MGIPHLPDELIYTLLEIGDFKAADGVALSQVGTALPRRSKDIATNDPSSKDL